MNVARAREGHLICLSTFRKMLNMAADDGPRAGARAAGVLRLLGSVGICIQVMCSCLDLRESHIKVEDELPL